MNRSIWLGVAVFTATLGLQNQAHAGFLGTADSYAVLAGSTVTNIGSTVLSGNLGVWPGTAITGFPPGLVTNGTIHAGDSFAQQAESDVTTAYVSLAGEAFTQNLTGQDLGGMTLTPGVYFFSSAAFLTGNLTLNAEGNPNARFDFQIGSKLVSASNSSIRMINSGDDCNVYWQVGSSATLGTNSAFEGHILALTDITINTGATILDGSALARNGQVTLDSNLISICPPTATPEVPTTIFMLAATGIGMLKMLRRRE